MSIVLPLVMSLGIGLLVGLQRQRAGSRMAGIRTFPLIALLGAVCAMLGRTYGGWVLGAGLLGVAAMIVATNVASMRRGRGDPGMTTEAAALLTYGVGAAAGSEWYAAALIVGGATAVLLQSKKTMHEFVRRIGEDELRAIFRFVLIAAVILPLLPDRAYGPLGVLNPFRVWLMVALVVGMGLLAYVVQKLLGQRVGTLLAGIFGGLISSTATTMSAARLSHRSPSAVHRSAAIVMICSAVVFARVLTEIALVGGEEWHQLAWPLAAMMGWMALLGAIGWWRLDKRVEHHPRPAVSTEARAAIGFGAVYAIVLLAVAAARQWAGESALYAVAVVSGLTDMDAITLSTAELASLGQIEPDTAWRLILLASLSNIVFKFAIVAMLGDATLKRKLAAPMAGAISGGAAILLLWPA
jgi:uncharacterized membrane protein (DUF4010 family)